MSDEQLPSNDSDDGFDWLSTFEEISPQSENFWSPIEELSDETATISERLRQIFAEMLREILFLFKGMFIGFSETLHFSGFKLFLTLLSAILVFRFIYPLFYNELPNIFILFRLLNTGVTINSPNESLIDFKAYFSDQSESLLTTMPFVNEFAHYLGYDAYKDLDLEKAKQSIDNAVTHEPTNSSLYLIRAEFLRVYFADCSGATESYTEAINIDHKMSLVHQG